MNVVSDEQHEERMAKEDAYWRAYFGSRIERAVDDWRWRKEKGMNKDDNLQLFREDGR